MSTVHNFAESLAMSHKMEEAPWWEPVYRQAFPNFGAMHSVRSDGWAQRGGIDRLVFLKSGKTVTIDEKVRAEKWPDILLERWSSKENQTPGWIQKDLACDFIAYAFVPSETCYLLPFLSLRKAWLDHGRHWISMAESGPLDAKGNPKGKDGFKVVAAKNNGYTTESIAVPTGVLLKSITESMSVSWTGSIAA